MREYYDRWAEFAASISARNRIKEGVRRVLTHAADRYFLKVQVTRLVAQSRTIQGRLAQDLGVAAEVLLPPPPQRAYRCDTYGNEIFAVSRLTPHKRVSLLLRALAEPAARHVRATIAGDGQSRDDLEELAASLGIAARVTFLGRIDDHTLLDRLADCRAVCFTPLDEDYGLVTVEAFASRKAVVTCRDSGGPTELVSDNQTGFVCDPTPASVADAIGRLMEDRPLAERLGANAAARATRMTWDDAVKQLVIA
jgi:glycosyltransferase involved in cell wall biosynthesis